jgi:hypothetical protein
MPCSHQNAFELLATTGVLPRTLAIPPTTRGTSFSRLVAAAIRTTTIRTIFLVSVVLGVLTKTNMEHTGHHAMTSIY